jgi:hypothetical protein
MQVPYLFFAGTYRPESKAIFVLTIRGLLSPKKNGATVKPRRFYIF